MRRGGRDLTGLGPLGTRGGLEAGERGGGYLVRYNALCFEGRFGERAKTVDAEQLAQRGLAELDLIGDEIEAELAPRFVW